MPSGSRPTRTQLRCGSTRPPTHTCSSRSVDTRGSRFTVTRPLVTSGRLTTRPNAPSWWCLHSSTTVRVKFGSVICGMDSRNVGASDEVILSSAILPLQRLRDRLQVLGELFHLAMPRLVVWRAQDRRGMHRREDERRERRRNELATLRGHLELPAEQRLSGSGAEAHDRARFDQCDLGIEPGTARRDLTGVRLLVDPPLAARLPFEVLDDIGDVDGGAIDAGVDEGAIEQLAGRSDEGMAAQVFVVARLLADEHQLRPFPAFAKHRLRAAQPEVARLALFRGRTNLVDSGTIRNQLGGRMRGLLLGHALTRGWSR